MRNHPLSAWRHRLTVAALLLLSAAGAQACEIWRDKELRVWRGNCNFRDFMVSHQFIANYQSRLILKLADLHIRKFKFTVIDRAIDIYADVENLGQAKASASPLAVDVSIANPVTGMQQGSSMQFTVQAPALASNTSQRVYVGTVFVPNNAQDWDLVLLGVTDPPTAAQPVRGAIVESDETNNMRNHTCRWYGPMPDTSVEACN